ncbi:hypothetical protein JCGZ_11601 [Jatropha curcas]|uniref:ABC transporter domain-containing protein n=1 Tax=Jatropha curcas TaxID=180498 RepID=A0A067KG68_JATCU|nr:ABC transporter A family member 7 [Jatropha curcas]KDP31225.1 hypothetical protein JCGZ_11601 [Jatropha curcas]
MADASLRPASSWTQADALFRKNLTYQKRKPCSNCILICVPVIVFAMLATIQHYIDSEMSKIGSTCGCASVDINGDGRREKVCGLQYTKDWDDAEDCPFLSPLKWPPLLHIPPGFVREYRSNSTTYTESCVHPKCPVTMLITGNNKSLAKILAGSMFTSPIDIHGSSNIMDSLAKIVLGTERALEPDLFIDYAFTSDASSLFYVQSKCRPNSTLSFFLPDSFIPIEKEAICVEALTPWHSSSSEINEEIYKENSQILAAYDFLNSDRKIFNVSIWYDPMNYGDFTVGAGSGRSGETTLLRVPCLVNMVSNAYIQIMHGLGKKVLFEFVKEMPKPATRRNFDISSYYPLFFTWVILLLFLVAFTSVVYEKQQKLRIMMKMHGLHDGPYWLISYLYFLTISLIYMLLIVICGSFTGLKMFKLNDYSIQFVFYFIYINLQISVAFLVAAFFSHVRTATVVGYIYIFGTGLLGGFLFQGILEDLSFPRTWLIALELYPGFSLYRGLYEFSEYAAGEGMQWENLNDVRNGMIELFFIMFVEWFVVLFVAYYMDQCLSSGSGKNPLFCLQNFGKKRQASVRKRSLRTQGSKVVVNMDKPDIHQEREKVEQLLLEPSTNHTIICDDLKKVYPGRDGNPDKIAVRGLSLALPPGECFGMLGPNGAGKTSFISMMIGLTKPTSGTAYVWDLNLQTQIDWIYTSMGVCPQDDFLWESLTGREHLLFYGRLKNLKGSALKKAVNESLKSVNLFNDGIADKHAGKYSGGMKRRLSVAISLIGNPKVVYMDEPSTGLDPASRRNLWNIIKCAKQDRAIILTTHSMEEAEALCDRLGVFVDGSFQCIGTPRELKARYGGSYVFTMTTSLDHEQQVANMVQQLSPNAERIYYTSGTQKFEMPKNEVRIADVFDAVETAKSRFPVFAWGLSDTTLEDVFIKVANGA